MLFEQALIIGETTCVLASVRAERTARTERLIEDNAPSPRRLPCSSGVAELDPLYRYERAGALAPEPGLSDIDENLKYNLKHDFWQNEPK